MSLKQISSLDSFADGVDVELLVAEPHLEVSVRVDQGVGKLVKFGLETLVRLFLEEELGLIEASDRRLLHYAGV